MPRKSPSVSRQTKTPSAAAWTLLRVVLGVQSIAAGVFSLVGWSATVRFNAIALGASAAAAATALGSAALILGGISLVTGRAQQLGALALLAFLIPATIRHFVVSRTLGAEGAALVELAVRGQLASAAKNVPLIALAAAILLEWKRSSLLSKEPARLAEP